MKGKVIPTPQAGTLSAGLRRVTYNAWMAWVLGPVVATAALVIVAVVPTPASAILRVDRALPRATPGPAPSPSIARPFFSPKPNEPVPTASPAQEQQPPAAPRICKAPAGSPSMLLFPGYTFYGSASGVANIDLPFCEYLSFRYTGGANYSSNSDFGDTLIAPFNPANLSTRTDSYSFRYLRQTCDPTDPDTGSTCPMKWGQYTTLYKAENQFNNVGCCMPPASTTAAPASGNYHANIVTLDVTLEDWGHRRDGIHKYNYSSIAYEPVVAVSFGPHATSTQYLATLPAGNAAFASVDGGAHTLLNYGVTVFLNEVHLREVDSAASPYSYARTGTDFAYSLVYARSQQYFNDLAQPINYTTFGAEVDYAPYANLVFSLVASNSNRNQGNNSLFNNGLLHFSSIGVSVQYKINTKTGTKLLAVWE